MIGTLRTAFATGPRLGPPTLPYFEFRHIVLAGVATGFLFGLYPQLDLEISALFYDQMQLTWPANQGVLSILFSSYRELSAFLGGVLAFIAVGSQTFAAVPPS
jgi:hypothetical protein